MSTNSSHLAFGVEAYVDSLLIPEMLMEGFQSSLRDALLLRRAGGGSGELLAPSDDGPLPVPAPRTTSGS